VTEFLAVLAAALGVLLWWLRSRGQNDSPKIRYAKRVVDRAHGRVAEARWQLQTRRLEDLEKLLDRQQRDMESLRSVLNQKSNKAPE